MLKFKYDKEVSVLLLTIVSTWLISGPTTWTSIGSTGVQIYTPNAFKIFMGGPYELIRIVIYNITRSSFSDITLPLMAIYYFIFFWLLVKGGKGRIVIIVIHSLFIAFNIFASIPG